MEGMEFVSQPWHEAVVVVDHAEEALKAGLGGRYREVIHCLNLGLKGHDA